MIFFPGVHQPCDAKKVPFACISINRLNTRKSQLQEPSEGWIMDSGAFTIVTKHGHYPDTPDVYAAQAARWVSPKLMAIVSQDFMCEPFVLQKTGLTVQDHQRMTVERYDALVTTWELERVKAGAAPDEWPPIMPVLQGWSVQDYKNHMAMYEDRLGPGAWVGVGSVCKRQGNVEMIETILTNIAITRPDLRLHGFGVKLTALRSFLVRLLLHSADSMAWSFAARYEGRNQNDIQEAIAFTAKIESLAA